MRQRNSFCRTCICIIICIIAGLTPPIPAAPGTKRASERAFPDNPPCQASHTVFLWRSLREGCLAHAQRTLPTQARDSIAGIQFPAAIERGIVGALTHPSRRHPSHPGLPRRSPASPPRHRTRTVLRLRSRRIRRRWRLRQTRQTRQAAQNVQHDAAAPRVRSVTHIKRAVSRRDGAGVLFGCARD